MFGSVVSESIQLSFGFIGEFNLQRPLERGNKNWGKTIFCDPPQYFPGEKWFVKYFYYLLLNEFCLLILIDFRGEVLLGQRIIS